MSEKAVSPHRATPGSVGYDLFTPIDFQIQPKEQKTVFIDLAIVPPEGYYAQLKSKSGLTILYELEVKAGVIDPDFTGNIGVVLKNNSDHPIECLAGEQIAQLLFVKVANPTLIQVTSLAKTERGEYGFGHTPTNAQLRRRFQRGLQILLDTFYDTMLLYTQDIQVVNFSNMSTGFINVIIMYKDVEERSVRLEALGNIDKDYVQTLDFLWQAIKRAAQDAPSDYSGPFSSQTLPTHNDLLKILDDLEL